MNRFSSFVKRRALFWSACLGNLFEHYDNALFGFLSPFLAPLIFPEKEPIVALILTYAMIPLGMLARPLGALFFGQIGDRYGRRVALSWSLLGMGFISLVIACTPTFHTAGALSPLLFCLGRILQNFFAAGESMGGAIYLLENCKPEKQDLMSSIYNASTIGGILLAAYGVASMGAHFSWRLLYFCGAITALFGAWVRSKRDKTPEILSSKNTLSILWQEKKAFLTIVIISGFSYASYTIALVVINGFIPLVTSLTKEEMAHLNTSLLIFDFALLPICGFFASKISREKMMLFASLSVVVMAAPLFSFFPNASFATVVLLRLLLVTAGVAFFAPFHAFTAALLPQQHRLTVISLGYAVGSQLLGGPTAAISLWLFQKTGIPEIMPLYWILLALASSAMIIKTATSHEKVPA